MPRARTRSTEIFSYRICLEIALISDGINGRNLATAYMIHDMPFRSTFYAFQCIIHHGSWSSTHRLLSSKSWCELVCNTRRYWYCISFFSSVVWVIDWTMTFDRHSRVIQHDIRFVTWLVSCQGTSHRTHGEQSNSNCCSLVWSMNRCWILSIRLCHCWSYLFRPPCQNVFIWLTLTLTDNSSSWLSDVHVLYVWHNQTSTNGLFAYSILPFYNLAGWFATESLPPSHEPKLRTLGIMHH
jgi:hypothetical protein